MAKTKKTRKLSHLTVVDKYVATIFGNELMGDIEKAMGYSADDMQIGNVTNRLRNLGERHLIAEIEEMIEIHNAEADPKHDVLTQDFWGRPI